MNSFKKMKSLISALTGAALLFSLPMTAGAESNINYTGMFLGYDGSVNTSPVWNYNPDIVSYDLLNWNQGEPMQPPLPPIAPPPSKPWGKSSPFPPTCPIPRVEM